MLAGAPNLHRAVAECTQPYCAPSAGAARALEKYLCDERCVDLVYLAVLSRAVAQPISEAVIAKCAAVLKQNLHRHTPSRGVLQAVQAGAARLAAALPSSSDVGKSLLFLSASAARLEGGSERPGAAVASSFTAGEDEQGRPHARGSAVGDSFSAPSQDSAATGAPRSLGRDSRQGLEGGAGPSGDEHWEASGEPGAGDDIEELLMMGAVRPVLGQGEAPPLWALAPEDLPWPHLVAAAEAAAAPTAEGSAAAAAEEGAMGGADGAAAVDWADLLPAFSGSLAPLLKGLREEAGGAAPPGLDCGEVVGAFSDGDPDSALRQMLAIAAARRQQLGATPDVLQAAAPPDAPLPRPVPYTQLDPLASIAPADVAAVLEVVLGRAGGAVAPSAVTGRWDEENQEAHWPQPPASGGGPGGGAGAARQPPGAARGAAAAAATPPPAPAPPPSEVLGPACAAVLVRLVVDMFLSAGSEAAGPLVLRMLQQALHHPDASVRARPFDVVYNLSLHGALLAPSSAGGGGSAMDDAAAAAARGSPMAWHTPGALAPPPPELAGQLFARPPSPGGASRQRGGGGGGGGGGPGGGAAPPVGQLPSPRIHLPQQVMQGGGAGSVASSGGSHSPRSPFSASAAATGAPSSPRQHATPQLQPGVSSPRSRLARGNTSLGGSALQQGGGGAELPWQPPAGALEAAFDSWLRALLFELLSMLAQLDERDEGVWRSAVGATLHLTTHAGFWVRDAVLGMPPHALRGLLRACLAFDWAPELHARLAQLVPLLLCTLGAPERAQREPSAGGYWRRSSAAAAPNGGGSTGSEGGRQPGSSGGGSTGGNAGPEGGGSSGGGAAACIPRRATATSEGGGWEYSGLDPLLLEEFGGAEELLHHFCRAASPEAQRCLLLPLMEWCIPLGTSPADAARAALALGGSPARLRTLQAVLGSGRPGLGALVAEAIGRAQAQDSTATALDPQLLSALLSSLESLSVLGAAGATADGVSPAAAAATTRHEGPVSAGAGTAAAAVAWGGSYARAAALSAAVNATLRHLTEGGPADGEAAAAWRALRELCRCGDAGARMAAARWLQQLLAAVVDNEGMMPIPEPLSATVTAAAATAPAAAAEAAAAAGPPEVPHEGVLAFSEALGHILGHCPWGPELLVDALLLHTASPTATARGVAEGLEDSTSDSGTAAAAAAAVGVAKGSDLEAARSLARAWALVLRWLLQAPPRAACRGALARLSDVAASLVCWPPGRAGPGADAAAATQGRGGSGEVEGLGDGDEEADASAHGQEQAAALDGVCRPQAFLAGQQLVSQDAVDALDPAALVALASRMLHCPRPPASAAAAARGFTTRLELGDGAGLLAPAGDAASDLQLTLVLAAVAACVASGARYQEAGLEGLARQTLVTAGDVRTCHHLAVCVLEHMMVHDERRYWGALKKLLAEAQGRDDAQLLSNPFLQLHALLGS